MFKNFEQIDLQLDSNFSKLIDSLEKVTTERGRYYVDSNSNKLLSMSTLLKNAFDNSGLENWKKAIGHANADRITKKASERGEWFHKVCELYLSNRSIKHFRTHSLWPQFEKGKEQVLDTRINGVYAVEQSLIDQQNFLAGTADCIALFDDIPSIIDFKSADNFTKVIDAKLHKYVLQTIGYASMISQCTVNKIVPQQSVIIYFFEEGDPIVIIFDVKKYMPLYERIVKKVNVNKIIAEIDANRN